MGVNLECNATTGQIENTQQVLIKWGQDALGLDHLLLNPSSTLAERKLLTKDKDGDQTDNKKQRELRSHQTKPCLQLVLKCLSLLNNYFI